MKKWFLRSLYAVPVLLTAGLAWSDYAATPGGPSTVFAFVCSATKICPASVLINSSNVEIATAGAPLRVDPTGTTAQPVSQATAANLNATVVGTVAATQSGTWTVQPGNTANTTAWKVDGTGGVFPSTQSGAWTVNPTTPANWAVGATGAAVPANASYIGINTGGNLVGWNGTVTATQATGTNLHMVCDSGCSGSGGTSSTFGAAFPSVGTAIGAKNGANMVNLTADASGNLNVNGVGLAQGASTSGQTGSLVMGAVTSGAPGYTTAQTSPISLDTAGNLRVNVVAGGGAGTPTGAAPPANATYQGALGSGATGGLVRAPITCDQHAFVDNATQLQTIVVGVSGRKTYLCGYLIGTGGTATNISLTSGTGTNCVTTSVAITPAQQLLANDRVGFSSPYWTGLITLANADNLCVSKSAANSGQIEVWYAIL